jgi:mRNA interferase RelE/StbE
LGTKSEKFIKNLEAETRTRIWEKLDQLKLNPFPSDVVRIVGKKLKSFRVRVGKYRIQYIVIQEKKEIVIFDINKRERAYD